MVAAISATPSPSRCFVRESFEKKESRGSTQNTLIQSVVIWQK